MLHSFRRVLRVVVPAIAAVALLLPSTALADPPGLLFRVTGTDTAVVGWTGAVGDVLTCVHSDYSGGTNVTVTHEWKRDGVSMGSGQYTMSTADFGKGVVCTETATNDEGDTRSDSSMTFRLSEPWPAEVTKPSIAGTVIAGRPVSCDGATFSGYNIGPLTYAWFKGGSGQIATGQTYTPTRADIGYQISCHATATNPTGSAESFSDQYQVEDGTPNVDTLPRISGKAILGLAVTCSTGTWSGEGNTYSFQWLVNDVAIAGATSNKLLLLDKFNDKTVTCRVTAKNASGSAHIESKPISPYHPPILAPLAKVQPPVPRVAAAIRTGIPSKLVCNASCATESHAFMLDGDAARLGITGKRVGGFTIIGIGHAHRTFKGELAVTTVFTPSAKKGLAKIKGPTRIDLLFETAWGPTYAFKMYHVAAPISIRLRR